LKIRNLERRLTRIGKVDEELPYWLKPVADAEDAAEYWAMRRRYRGRNFIERESEFAKRMRAKHPDMPLTIEEQMDAYAQRLKNEPELRKLEGLE